MFQSVGLKVNVRALEYHEPFLFAGLHCLCFAKGFLTLFTLQVLDLFCVFIVWTKGNIFDLCTNVD